MITYSSFILSSTLKCISVTSEELNRGHSFDEDSGEESDDDGFSYKRQQMRQKSNDSDWKSGSGNTIRQTPTNTTANPQQLATGRGGPAPTQQSKGPKKLKLTMYKDGLESITLIIFSLLANSITLYNVYVFFF